MHVALEGEDENAVRARIDRRPQVQLRFADVEAVPGVVAAVVGPGAQRVDDDGDVCREPEA